MASAPAWPAASTRVAAVIGDPVDHSLSPILHNAAFAALGLDWVYVALPVPTGQVAAAMAGVRALGVAALSVTMPHKEPAAAEMDRLSPTAARLGAVNTVTWHGSQLSGDSTDGAGLVDSLRLDEGWEPAGRRCVVLGAGPAARAVILALAEADAATVAVVARKPEAVAAAVALAGPAGRGATIEAVGDAELIVNATSVGMAGVGDGLGLPFDLDEGWLGSGQLVVDLIYSPPSTPLVNAARDRGARVANGLGTLIHQAAHQQRLWTGMDPPLEVMSAAAVAALVARDHPPAELGEEVGL